MAEAPSRQLAPRATTGAASVFVASALAGDEPLSPNDKVGDYVVEAEIAQGGFGTVYRVVHPLIGKSAAIKVLKREFSANPEMVSRFVAEARAVNQIRHKNIVDIFAFGVLPDGRQYYVMELLEGTTLDEWVRAKGGLPLNDAIAIFKQLGRALAAAHAAGITHRDLKPENVLLTFDEDGAPMPKLVDFGIAKLRPDAAGNSADSPPAKHKTRSGIPMGTPLYMSPEQVHGHPCDHRADIYALGVVAHEVLTGSPPFDGGSVLEVLAAHATKPPPPLSSKRPDLPRALDLAVGHMLEKSPDARPQSVMAAVDALVAAAGLEARDRRTDVSTATPSAWFATNPPRSVVRGAPDVEGATIAGSATPSHARAPSRVFGWLGASSALVFVGVALIAAVRGRGGSVASSAPEVIAPTVVRSAPPEVDSAVVDVTVVAPPPAPVSPSATVTALSVDRASRPTPAKPRLPKAGGRRTNNRDLEF